MRRVQSEAELFAICIIVLLVLIFGILSFTGKDNRPMYCIDGYVYRQNEDKTLEAQKRLVGKIMTKVRCEEIK